MPLRRLEKLIDPFRSLPDIQPPANVWRFYAHFLREVYGVLAFLLLVRLLDVLIEVALSDSSGRIIDTIQITPSAEFFSRHRSELLWMVFVALIVRSVIFGLHGMLVHQVINPNLSDLIRWQSHRYVFKQSLTFSQNDFAGRIAQRIMQIGFLLHDSAVQVADALWYVVIYTISAMALFARTDWWLVVPLLVWIGCYIAVLSYFVPHVKARLIIVTESRSKLVGRIVDGYTNITTLKLFAHTQHEEGYAREAMAEQTDKTRLSGHMVSGMDFIITTTNSLLIVDTSVLALWLWNQGRVSTGTIVLTTGLVIHINNTSGWTRQVVNGIFENADRMQDDMQTIALSRVVIDQPDAKPLQVIRGEVHFEYVGFHHGKGSGMTEGLDLVVRPGERIGLVGPSGAGKSTLVNLLLRLYDVECGWILVDGQDIVVVTQESLREQTGMVTQDTSLLYRPICDNLCYGRPDSTEAELMQAMHRARADGFIPQLFDAQGRCGFDTLVGGRGVKPLGGQRQRITIVRVLLKNAPIPILDEVASALDSEVEVAVQESLETLMQGKTVIAIAHRLLTVACMDRLVVLDGGRIVESGMHVESLEHGELYARLWVHQTGGFVGVD